MNLSPKDNRIIKLYRKSLDHGHKPDEATIARKNGCCAENKLGYKFSWGLNKDFTNSSVTNLRPATHSWDNLSQADVGAKIKDQNGDVRVILEVGASGKTFLVSCYSDFNSTFNWNHIEEAKKSWTFLDEEPTEEVVEMTVEEVSKLVGKKVKIVE